MLDRALCWLRRDLRLHDNSALAEATHAAKEVYICFIFDTNILEALEDPDDKRVTFIQKSVAEIEKHLAKRGAGLIVRHGDPRHEIPFLTEELGVQLVCAGRDHEPYAINRDEDVARSLKELHIELRLIKDHVVRQGDEVVGKEGKPFRIFSPYMRAWSSSLEPQMLAERKADPSRLAGASEKMTLLTQDYSLQKLGFEEADLWLDPGEAAARKLLQEFVGKMGTYSVERNFPANDGTSKMSVHYRFGTVSIREAFRLAMDHNANKYVSELIWREFYSMILFQFPHVAKHAFRTEFDKVDWPGTETQFDAWTSGRTGYPIVDAAMTCLNQTGYMNNRLRMVAASFLTKDLIVNYKKGEAYFARKLLDFDLASNNGGWQWTASTGVDPQPYFRVFNPVLQSGKFDPNGDFIRMYCPELTKFDNKWIHFPADAPLPVQEEAGCVIGKDYPLPIVNHSEQRPKVIKLLESARQ